MSLNPSLHRPVTIAAYPHKLIQLFESEWQIPAAQLLAGTQLSLDQLDRPDRLVPLLDVFLMFENAMRLCPEPDLALRYGARLPPGMHGQLGVATLTAATLRDVITLYYDYLAVVAPFVLLHQEQRNQQLLMVFEVMPQYPVQQRFVLELLMVAAFNIAERLLGDRVRAMAMHFAGPAPAHVQRLQAYCRGTLNFNASCNGIGIPESLLDVPLATADAAAHADALQQINERMDQIMARGSFVTAVRHFLRRQEGPLPRMAAVADAFSVSVRTFRNRLGQHGTSFQVVLDEERQALARHYLRETDMPIKELAWRLGFQESSNFSRVFKRWTGLTPLLYRQLPSVSP